MSSCRGHLHHRAGQAVIEGSAGTDEQLTTFSTSTPLATVKSTTFTGPSGPGQTRAVPHSGVRQLPRHGDFGHRAQQRPRPGQPKAGQASDAQVEQALARVASRGAASHYANQSVTGTVSTSITSSGRGCGPGVVMRIGSRPATGRGRRHAEHPEVGDDNPVVNAEAATPRQPGSCWTAPGQHAHNIPLPDQVVRLAGRLHRQAARRHRDGGPPERDRPGNIASLDATGSRYVTRWRAR
jgi:hypothetical protein